MRNEKKKKKGQELPYEHESYLTVRDNIPDFCRRAASLQEFYFSASVSTFLLEVEIVVSFFFQLL